MKEGSLCSKKAELSQLSQPFALQWTDEFEGFRNVTLSHSHTRVFVELKNNFTGLLVSWKSISFMKKELLFELKIIININEVEMKWDILDKDDKQLH